MKKTLFVLLYLFASHQSSFAQVTWTPISPDSFPTNASGQIHGISRTSQVKFHPSNSSKMYAVSSRGGLFTSINSGNNWTLTAGSDVLPPVTLNSVCIDHTNDQVLYVGTGDGNYYSPGIGVYKTTDGGTTFTSSGLGGRLILEILMDPLNNQVLIAATDSGIYKSVNAGTSWTLKTIDTLTCRDMVFKAKAGTRTLFASTLSALYRSTDMGDTWTRLTSGLYVPAVATNGGGCRVAVTPADSNVVYFAMVAKNGTIFKSTDGGNNFTVKKDSVMPNLTAYDSLVGSMPGQGDYNFMINADPVNANILYLGSHGLWKSTNSGANWSRLTFWSQVLHTDMHWIKVNPYNTSELWTANDGGVWKSTNAGVNWTPRSHGLYGYEIYFGSCSPTRRDMMSIGTQDNGELYRSTNTWFTNRGGDWGSRSLFDYRSNSSMVYYFANNSGFKRRLVTGGDATYGLPAAVTSIQDIGFYRANPNRAFVASLDVFRTSTLLNTTPSWTKITNINKAIRAVHVHMADSNKLYLMTSDSFFVSTNALNATPTYTKYALPNPANNVASITSIKSFPNVLYAVMNTRVYRSADNGANWTNVSYNLPSVNWVRILPDEYFSSKEMVFVAGANMVYYKTVGQTNWTLFSNSLPARTLIRDFTVFDDGTNQSILRVAEYGRGMWEAPMSSLRSVTAAFTVSNRYPCTGNSVQFFDQSTGSNISWTWTFPGGTPSSSTLQNPTVTYTVAGTYNVTLNVNDGVNPFILTKSSYITTIGASLPLNEGFESFIFPPDKFTIVDDANDGFTWYLTQEAGGFGTSSSSVKFDNFNNNVTGTKDEIRLAPHNIMGLTTATLTFDVAYQPYPSASFYDSLEVLVSTNCGGSFTAVYLKGGPTLSTAAGNNDTAFAPLPSQWRTETISLNSYTTFTTVLIAFRNRAHYGNNIYIDNIKLNGTITANAGVDKAICYGGGTPIGSASVAGLTYSWAPNIALTSPNISNPNASPTFNVTYVVTVSKSGTSIIGQDTMNLTVDQVPIGSAVTNAGCYGGNNGAIDQTFTTGIAPYTYLWNNNATTQDRTNLSAGVYTVTITDGSGCSRQYLYVVSQPNDPLGAATTSNDAFCNMNTGSATADGYFGTPPYTYLWSTGATTTTVNNLYAGNYTVRVTDAYNCTYIAPVTVYTIPLPVINSFTPSGNPACFGVPFTLNVNASGGIISNTYQSGVSFAIPDNQPAGITSQAFVQDSRMVTTASRLAVNLTFGTGSSAPSREHTWVGDLKATLSTPGGSTIIFDRPGRPVYLPGNDADMNGSYTFRTSAAAILPQTNSGPAVVGGNIVNGNYKPSDSGNPDAAHNWAGLTFPFNIYGGWDLNISDNAGSDLGDLISWSIIIDTLYKYVITGPGTIGAINCTNDDCSNASVTVTNAPLGNNNYAVTVTSPDGCSVSANTTVTVSNTCTLSLTVKAFIEGYYVHPATMTPVLYNSTGSGSTSSADSLTVELRNQFSPLGVLFSAKKLMDVNGNIQLALSSSFNGGTYYIVVRHRNSIETWSKLPVTLGSNTTYDFRY